jgi:hypothetical protein
LSLKSAGVGHFPYDVKQRNSDGEQECYEPEQAEQITETSVGADACNKTSADQQYSWRGYGLLHISLFIPMEIPALASL